MIWGVKTGDILGGNYDRDVGVVNADMCELWHCLVHMRLRKLAGRKQLSRQ